MEFDLNQTDELLSTTRAVRKRLDFDRAVPRDVIEECIGLSQQAPTGTNSQGWRWLIIEDAEKRMRHLRNNLAENEIHIANYYMRRGAFIAAVNRARYVIENYDRTPVVPEALILMAKAYRVLEMEDLANDALRVLKLNYPNHPGIYQIEELEIK